MNVYQQSDIRKCLGDSVESPYVQYKELWTGNDSKVAMKTSRQHQAMEV